MSGALVFFFSFVTATTRRFFVETVAVTFLARCSGHTSLRLLCLLLLVVVGDVLLRRRSSGSRTVLLLLLSRIPVDKLLG